MIHLRQICLDPSDEFIKETDLIDIILIFDKNVLGICQVRMELVLELVTSGLTPLKIVKRKIPLQELSGTQRVKYIFSYFFYSILHRKA